MWRQHKNSPYDKRKHIFWSDLISFELRTDQNVTYFINLDICSHFSKHFKLDYLPTHHLALLKHQTLRTAKLESWANNSKLYSERTLQCSFSFFLTNTQGCPISVFQLYFKCTSSKVFRSTRSFCVETNWSYFTGKWPSRIGHPCPALYWLE